MMRNFPVKSSSLVCECVCVCVMVGLRMKYVIVWAKPFSMRRTTFLTGTSPKKMKRVWKKRVENYS